MNTKTKRIFFLIFPVVVLMLLLHSCFKDDYDMKNLNRDVAVSPVISMPIGYTQQTTEDVLKSIDGNIDVEIDETTNLLHIIYKEDILSLRGDEVLDLTEQLDQFTFGAGFGELLYNTTFPADSILSNGFPSETYQFVYSNAAQKLDQLILDEITVDYTVNNKASYPLKLIVEYLDVKVNDVTVKDTLDVDPNTESMFSVPLEEVIIDFDNESVPGQSVLNLVFQPLYKGTPGNTLDDGFDLDIAFSNIDFSAAYGYIGKHDMLNPLGNATTLPINMFENSYEGILEFKQPILKFDIQNSYGAPINVVLKDAYTFNEHYNTSKQVLFGEAFEDSATFEIAASTSPGTYTTTDYTLDNLSFEQALNINPNIMSFITEGTVNPDGVEDLTQFVVDSSMLTASMILDLQMYVNTSNYTMRDTMAFDFESLIGDLDIVETMVIGIEVENGLPASAMIQLYFLDSNYVKVDSLFKDVSKRPNVPSAPVDNVNNRANGKTHQYDEGEIYEPAIKMIGVKHILIQTQINTFSNNGSTQFVNFYADDEIYINLGLMLQLNYEGSIPDLMDNF